MEYFFNVNTGRVEQRPISTGLPFNIGQFNTNQSMQQIEDPNKKFNIVIGPDGSFLRQALNPPAKMMPVNTADTAQFFFPPSNTGITASSAAIPFGTPVDIAQGFVEGSPSDQGTNFQFLASANEADETDEVRESQSGIAKLFEFLQKFSPVGNIAQGLVSLFNPKGSSFYRPATQGILGYTPAELNRMNALGGYYSEPARQQRIAEKRLANLIKRRDEGKSYSQKNLDMLSAALEGAPSQAQFATQKAAAKSPKVGVSGYTARDDIRESRRGKY